MVILYVSLVVFRSCTSQLYPALDLPGVYVCVCLCLCVCVCGACVRACVCVCTANKFSSVHKHTSFYRPNQEECVCLRAFVYVLSRLCVCVRVSCAFVFACMLSQGRGQFTQLKFKSWLSIMTFLTEEREGGKEKRDDVSANELQRAGCYSSVLPVDQSEFTPTLVWVVSTLLQSILYPGM